MKKPFIIIEYPGDIRKYNRAKVLITCVEAEDKDDALRIFNNRWAPRKALNIVVKEL